MPKNKKSFALPGDESDITLITALAISLDLPMRVRSRNAGMFCGEVIRFNEVRDQRGADWQLSGNVEFEPKKHVVELTKDRKYERLF